MSRLSSDEWLALADIAHRAIEAAVLENRLADFPPYPPALSEPRGAFVSLYCEGLLRGCVGQVENPGPLAEVVARSAISAALYDSRFAPIAANEIAGLKVELSILTTPARILPKEIVTGQHGLLVVRGELRGLLLPQVAEARNWASQRFLEETCVKAGLPRTAWSDPATQIFGFTAEIFAENRAETGPES